MTRTFVLFVAGIALGASAAFALLAGAAREPWAVVPSPVRSRTVDSTELDGTVAASVDPAGVVESLDAADAATRLTRAADLRLEARAVHRARAAAEWAMTEPDAFLAYASAVPDLEPIMVGLELLAASHAEEVFEIAARLPFDRLMAVPHPLRQLAFTAIAERDPRAALARIEGMNPYGEYGVFFALAFDAYARVNVDTAAAWLQAQRVEGDRFDTTVARAIARTDLNRALALLEGNEVSVLFAEDSATAERAATALLARGEAADREALAGGMFFWVRRDPQAALDWASAHAGELDSDTTSNVAQSLAISFDPALAKRYVDALDREQRTRAIMDVVGSLAAQDPAAALAWIGPLRGEAAYESALLTLVATVARSDAPAAARMLDRAAPAVKDAAAGSVASSWASQDAPAAAAWVFTLGDGPARISALGSLATAWAPRDRTAARDWALGLPSGAERDAALKPLIAQSLQRSDFDARLVGSMSTEALRERAVTDLIKALPGHQGADSAYARFLLDRYVRDPELQRQAGIAIESLLRSGR